MGKNGRYYFLLPNGQLRSLDWFRFDFHAI